MDTKKRIVDTASRLFYQQGYNSTGINQIIAEADVAKTSLYQHFRSKEDLLVEYLENVLEWTLKGLRHAAAGESGSREKISAIFSYMIGYVSDKSFYGCNFLNIAAEMPKENGRIIALIQRQKNGIRALFTEILREGAPEDVDARQEAESLADELYILFDGALMSCRVYGDSWPAVTAQKLAAKLL